MSLFDRLFKKNNCSNNIKEVPQIKEKKICDLGEIETSKDNMNTDYIQTVFLSLFQKKPYKKETAFPGYITYELGIINTNLYFESMIENGFLIPSSFEEILNLLTVPKLKDLLDKHGLKKTGKKSDLINRILFNINPLDIPKLSERYYSLSQQGLEFIKKHEDYIIIRRNPQWMIDIKEYQKIKKLSEPKNFPDIILSLLNIQLLEIKKNITNLSQYEYSRLNELYISAFSLLKEKEDHRNSLKVLLSSVLLSLSGCQNYWLIAYKKGLHLKNAEVLKNYSEIHIDKYVLMNLIRFKEYYSIEIAKEAYKNFIGPYNLCPEAMFLKVIEEIFNSSILNLEPYNSYIRQEFIEKLK